MDLRAGPALVHAAMRHTRHTDLNRRMARFGLHLAPVPFPAALYVFGHGENDQTHKGSGTKQRGLFAASALGPSDLDEVLSEFGVT